MSGYAKAARRKPKRKSAVDLFCGAGGASTGLAIACEQLHLLRPALVAVNHWDMAVATHKFNHPWADHHCARVESLDPGVVVGQSADMIVAGVECTHHSQARGGRPMSDQSRASAWNVLHWAEQLRARDLLIENVPEFMSWGPLTREGRPIKARKGETFLSFIAALESLGYRVEWRVINSADYGDPQKRRRLFLRARAARRAITWPDTTHDESTWRTARGIIDWSDLGSSIYSRARPLAKRTMARIAAGIERYAGQSFLVPRYGERPTQAPRTHSIDEPIPTVAGTNSPQLITPFILAHDQWTAKNGVMVDDIGAPLRTVTAHNARNNKLCTPFVTAAGRVVDIYLRGLTPRELARAQSFPDEYQFLGNKGEQVKQIGNAVPVSTATQLCRSILDRAA